jgi:RecA-family ATPase
METLTREEIEKLNKAEYQNNDKSINRNYDPWIIEPLIPDKAITILDGLGGSGKSWFAMDLAFSISIGEGIDYKGQKIDFLGRYPVKRSGKVLYFTAEETPEAFVQRLDSITMAYGDNDSFYWVSTLHEDFPFGSTLFQDTSWGITKTKTVDAIEYYIKKRRPILVVLDSLINFYGLNENDSTQANMFYDVIKKWIKTYKCSFLILHHQTKEALRAKEEDGTFRGSIVFREQARQRLTYRGIKMEKGKGIARKVSIEKANFFSPLLEDFPIYLRWTEGVHIYDEQYEKEAKKQEEDRKKILLKPKNNKQDKQGGRNNGDSTNLTGKTF